MNTQGIPIRVACAQINSTVGDIEGNCKKILAYLDESHAKRADILCFPELTICGYPPEDLLLKDSFITANFKALQSLAQHISDTIVIIGFPLRKEGNLFNAAAIIYNKTIQGIYCKTVLSNYGIFNESRYFSSGTETPLFSMETTLGNPYFGITICRDLCHPNNPIATLVNQGAGLIVNINASPYHRGKVREREETICEKAKSNHVHILYANLVGGQDELVFDGQSFLADTNGTIIARAKAFEEDLLCADILLPSSHIQPPSPSFQQTEKPSIQPHRPAQPSEIEEVYRALCLGVRDYVEKNSFPGVAIGISGGIDSALVAAIACDSLGSDKVHGLFMPSRFTSKESFEDAHGLAELLRIDLKTLSIEEPFSTFLTTLAPNFSHTKQDTTEENLQARIRGIFLMAFSNKFGWLVLTSGNKSEMSTGYTTLYGDMAGGFAVIKDVPKILVYDLVRYRNTLGKVVPERMLVKAPTAELNYNQKDQDTLPPYEILDAILKLYVEEDRGFEEITALGFDTTIVRKVLIMVEKSEYKRRQAPPGIKITPKSFGHDRRMPITNKYRA